VTPEGRGLRAEAIRDAAIAGAQAGLARQFLELAARELELAADELRRKHPDVGTDLPEAVLERAGVHTRQALNELNALRLTLRDHFDRLGAPPSLELNRP
jgi:hypothetical protein